MSILTRSFVLASILALTPTLALAAPPSSEADKAAARGLTRDGYTALEAKDYAGALDRFTRAEAFYHAPSVLLGLARAQAGLGKLTVARATYERLLGEALPPRAPPIIVKVYDEARAELAILSARIPQLTLKVQGAPSPRVTLDDVEVAPAALGVNRPADVGKHRAHAEATGFTPVDVEVFLAEAQSETITLDLKRAAVPTGPLPNAEPAPAWPLRRKLGVGLAAGGVAVLGAGIGIGAAALGKRGTLARACPTPDTCPASQQGVIDSYHALGNASLAMMIVGGAAAGAGAFLFFTSKPARPVEQVTMTPRIGAGYVGVEGSF